jgi:NAD(P)-dependent dehydrogenase (short-subunit alcohol dehydrogenase family)
MNNMDTKPVCIVTGGSAGIGFAVCEKFLAEGYQVVNLDITQNKATSNQIQWLECDISKPVEVEAAIDKIIEQYKRIDALVSNAGVHFSANIEDTCEQDLDRIFAINVKGAYAAIRAVLPAMKSQRSGAIILMASDQAVIAKHKSFAYNLSKAALASIAKTTALDYAKFNIRANAVCPGTIETPLYHKAIDSYVARYGADKAQVHAEEAALQPLGRLGQAEEVAELSYFLASDKASFITGSLQMIDGGYTAQ